MAVQVDLVIILLRMGSGVESELPEGIFTHYACGNGFLEFLIEFGCRADAFLFFSVFGPPDGERRPPETASGEIPVLQVLQPFAETSRTGGLGIPLYGPVQFDESVLNGRGADKPAVQRIVENRLVGSPAVRIRMDVLLYFERLVLRLEHHADVDIQSRSLRAGLIVICILHITSGVGSVFPDIHPLRHESRIQFLYPVHSSLPVHLSLRKPVDILHHEGRDSGLLGDLVIIRTESGGDVDDTGTVLGGHIIPENHPEGTFVGTDPGNQLFISDTFEIRPLHPVLHYLPGNRFVTGLIIFEGEVLRLGGEMCIQKGFGHYVASGDAGIWVE